MHVLTNLLVALACCAVAVVLMMGLYNTWRGGDPNLSQRLMRWRIGLQFVAIIIIMGVLFTRQHFLHPA